MNLCEFSKDCSVFKIDFSDVTKEIFRKHYCYGDEQYRCARRRLQSQGRAVPDYLLPSGHLAKSLQY